MPDKNCKSKSSSKNKQKKDKKTKNIPHDEQNTSKE